MSMHLTPGAAALDETILEPPPANVLVVEDDPISRLLLAAELKQLGHTVVEAENGRVALELLTAREVDLIFLDVAMPEVDGLAVLRRAKSSAQLRDIPILMTSASDELSQVVQCIELGAEDYLTKPVNSILLRARTKVCLAKKRWHDREQMYRARLEAETARYDELLHVIFPPGIVDELKRTGAVKPRRFDNVAVMFCDVVGFTAHCDLQQPEAVLGNLQSLVHLQEDLAREYGLLKIKTVGDAFLATAGLLDDGQDAAGASVACALEIVRRVPLEVDGWQLRVGIHLGPVMAGVVGHRQYSFDIWGDTVNTSARLESLSQPGCVTVSDAVWEPIKTYATSEVRHVGAVKGKGKMTIYEIRSCNR